MATDVLLPQLGFSMSEGVLVEWLVADGSPVTQGQMLFSLETDKTVQELEAPASGTLRALGVPGETYPVGTVIGTIE